MAGSPPRHSDSWMKECEEAMHLADDISVLITERVSNALDHPSRLMLTIRRTFTMLVTKLDRLESLLRNPPVNVNLSDKELRRRDDLLLQLRTRTKEMASSLRVSQVSKRADLASQDAKPLAEVPQSNLSAAYDSERPLNLQEYVIIEQAKDPVAPSNTGAFPTTESASFVDAEMNLRNPLLVTPEETSDSTFVKISRIFTYLARQAEEQCSPMYMCLVFLCFVVFVIFLLSMLNLF